MTANSLRAPVAKTYRAFIAFIYVVPLVWIVLTSLKHPGDVIASQASILFSPTLDAYRDLINDERLFSALWQSLIIASGSTAVVLLISVPAGYALARSSTTVVTVGLGLLIVLQMMPQTANVIPLYQLFASLGMLDSTFSLILADSALLTPFAILLMRPFFRGVPLAIEESASMDGASNFRSFWSISLPLARNGIATTGTLVFLIVWGEFLYAVNFFISPGKYPLSALIASQVSAFGINWPGLMALAVLTSIPILIVFSATYRLLQEGITIGAVK